MQGSQFDYKLCMRKCFWDVRVYARMPCARVRRQALRGVFEARATGRLLIPCQAEWCCTGVDKRGFQPAQVSCVLFGLWVRLTNVTFGE